MQKENRLSEVIILLICVILAFSCEKNDKALPILGHRDVVNGDTIYHSIPQFNLVNHHGDSISNEDFHGKVLVVDDFFTSCPTICPKVKKQELRLFNKFRNHDEFNILSISIDHRRDSVPRLNDYATKIGIDRDNWHLATGDKDHIYNILNQFFLIGLENDEAPGGYDHSGALILIDGKGHIRAVADGTDPKSIDGFMDDITWLLDNNETKN